MTAGEYWEKRAIERAIRLERGTLPYMRKLSALYAKAYRSLREDLDKLFERYAETGDFTPEEAAAYLKEPVTLKERKLLEKALDGITDEDERRKAVARINSASYRARMNRIRAMQERIRIECAKTAPDVIDTIREAMEKGGREAYYRTIFDNSQLAGVQLPFTDLSLERLEGVINQKIEGKSFSARVWGNTNAVAQLLTDTLKENVATGRSWRRSVSDMRELLGVDYPGGATYAATRILRTETARVNNELSAEANVENGFDRYRYIAMLDSKTTEACRDHDGGIDPDTKEPYYYRNKKLGVNFPPLHPNCRSTTSAWVSEELLAKITRTAKDENGNVYQIPGNMTYREWEAWKGRDAMSRIPGKVGNFGEPKGRISAEDLAGLDKHAKQAGIRLDTSAFSAFDGDVELVHETIDDIGEVVKDFPEKLFSKKPVCLTVSYRLKNREADYSVTENRTITLNGYAFRDKDALARDYQSQNLYVEGSDYHSIGYHEAGHCVAHALGYSKESIKAMTDVLSRFIPRGVSISIYGNDSPSEGIAELFSAHYSRNCSRELLTKADAFVTFLIKRGVAISGSP